MVVPALASAAEKSPQAIVEQATSELFATVKKHNASGKVTDAYYTDIQKTLDSVVDFGFIAKAVMRKTAKTATPEQIEKFTEVFKKGLIRTYAKGIANYSESSIKTIPVTAPADTRRVSVDQEVSDKGNTHKLSYTMKLNDAGEWKLINVVLNGVNLGESFTSQFDQAMIKNDKDVDKVIATWLAAN
jgi:phospholipid transport system substrate-binding protein